MKYEVKRVPLARLALNEGQIEGLPANPRQWTREDITKIAASLKETPELFELRPIIAVPFKDMNVILAGSLRFCGAKENGDKDAPAIILPEDMPVEKMQEIVIKDNGSFGAWDFDALANEWDALPLADWGVPAWNTGADIDYDSLDIDTVGSEGESKTGMQSITFVFSQEDAEIVNGYIGEYTKEGLISKIVEICRGAEVK